MKNLLFIAVGFIALSAAITTATGSPPTKYKYVLEKHFNYSAPGTLYEISAENFYSPTALKEALRIDHNDPALMPVTTVYKRKKFVSHNRKINKYNTLLYGASAKQITDSNQDKDEIVFYNNVDIPRPAWQEYSGLLTKVNA